MLDIMYQAPSSNKKEITIDLSKKSEAIVLAQQNDTGEYVIFTGCLSLLL